MDILTIVTRVINSKRALLHNNSKPIKSSNYFVTPVWCSCNLENLLKIFYRPIPGDIFKKCLTIISKA